MSSNDFYANLSHISCLADLTEPDHFIAAPEDWFIIITDITNSTQAIASGKYKEVNLLGAASISAILNLAQDLEIPFVFGGDGAEILIPPSLLLQAKDVLVSVQELARAQFDFYLRVGIVPIAAVVKAGYEVKVAKLQVSKNYNQALITGGGIAYATEFIKEHSIPNLYQLRRGEKSVKADFSGLECRWQDIPARHDEAVTLTVLAIAHDGQRNHHIYRGVLDKIQQVYGSNQNFHPILSKHLNLSLNSTKLTVETKLRSPSKNKIKNQLYLLKIKLENLLGMLFMSFKVMLDGTDWGLYKKIVIHATDYQKFDDMLRMIISGNRSQRTQLVDYLDAEYTRGHLVYGVHISDRLLMTCLVFERSGRQVHFIDGADGGYAEAAKALKEQMRRKSLNWKVFLNMIRLRKNVIPYNL